MHKRERKDICDVQRKRLYDAENRVSEGLVWDSLMAAQQYVDELLASSWWQRQFPSVRCVVLFDQGAKYALAHKGVHGGAIQFPPRACTQLTLLHELAHLASPTGDGRAWPYLRRHLPAAGAAWHGGACRRPIGVSLRRTPRAGAAV